jgi:hypothetical protein
MTLKVTGGAAALFELLDDIVTITVIVELEMAVIDVISLEGNTVDELDVVPRFGASVEMPTSTEREVELLLLEPALVLVALSVLRLLELEGLAVRVVKLLRYDIVLLERNTPVVYVYDILTLEFDRHEAGIVKQQGSPVVDVLVGTKTPE